jgi:tetratricopeptide (TPR) repeat protein
METKTGNILKSEILYADSQFEILATLDKLSKRIRRELGESRYNIANQDRPLAKVTTSSLEALKLYSLGIDHHLATDFAGAKDYYEQALQVDSGFTAAKASLGNLMIEKFDAAEGRKWLTRAVRSIDNLTEREKLAILASYAVNVDRNISGGIEYTKMRIELYPDDPVARNNLGWYYQNSGRYEEAVKEYKAAIRINPNMTLAYGGMLWIYLEELGDADSALLWSGKMISDNPRSVWGYINLGAAWTCLDSLKKAEAAYEKAREINPDMTLNLYRLAHTLRQQGQYNEAIALLNKIKEIDPADASAFYDLGVNYQSMGKIEEAKSSLNKFKNIVARIYMRKWPDDGGMYINMSAVMARLGDMDSSSMMLQKAIKCDSTLYERFAEVLCLQGNVPEALNQLEKAFKNGYRNLFWLKLTPDLQILRFDSRYQDLLKKFFR